jgi:hypothetical protein
MIFGKNHAEAVFQRVLLEDNALSRSGLYPEKQEQRSQDYS